MLHDHSITHISHSRIHMACTRKNMNNSVVQCKGLVVVVQGIFVLRQIHLCKAGLQNISHALWLRCSSSGVDRRTPGAHGRQFLSGTLKLRLKVGALRR